MNKKAAVPIAIVLAVVLALFFLIFAFGGGISAAWNLANLINSIITTLKSIPTPIWIIIGFIFLIRMIGRKR